MKDTRTVSLFLPDCLNTGHVLHMQALKQVVSPTINERCNMKQWFNIDPTLKKYELIFSLEIISVLISTGITNIVYLYFTPMVYYADCNYTLLSNTVNVHVLLSYSVNTCIKQGTCIPIYRPIYRLIIFFVKLKLKKKM